MNAWWTAMTLAQQIFAAVGIVSTLVLLIQTVLLVFTAAGGSGADVPQTDINGPGVPEVDTADMLPEADFAGPHVQTNLGEADGPAPQDAVPAKGGGLHLFTLQGVVSFAAVFGWGGLVLLKTGAPLLLCLPLAVLLGLAAMVGMALIMRSMLKLQEDGTFDIRACFGQTGTVYLPIYPKRSQPGKVTLTVGSRYLELEAVTDVDHVIKTGTQVTVVGISGNTLVVID